MAKLTDTLDVDLQAGVVPISAAASQLARRLKQAAETKTPIIVTQKGYPTGVILDIETYTRLKDLARAADGAPGEEPPATA